MKIFENKLFWIGLISVCAGGIIGFQNQIPANTFKISSDNILLQYSAPIIKATENLFSSTPTSTVSAVQTVPQRTTISAPAYGTYYVSPDGTLTKLIGVNVDEQYRIASITKLMVALLASENMNANDVITISQNDIGFGTDGRYKVGDRLTLGELLHSLLIESDNDAARAIADNYKSGNFIQAMNSEAQKLRMTNTRYFDPSGVDGNVPEEDNLSTVSDLTKLVQYLEFNHPDIFAITALDKYDIRDASGNFHHTAFSTDQLIDEFAVNFFVGGKTGNTTRAKQCLIILRAKNGDEGYYIDTVLASDDRFGDMKLLIGKTPN